MSADYPDDARPCGDPAELIVRYLDYYRETVAAKLLGLSEAELRTSRLPSGWTPLELLKHLVAMERRWLRWGFRAEQVPDPWFDARDDRWYVGPEESVDDLVAALLDGGRTTSAIVASAALTDRAQTGGRFADEQEAPTLAWILFHVLHEYARHAGHLDIARELADGATGE